MASPIYGPINPNVVTVEYPAAADEVWMHAGANFCFLDGSGRVSQSLTGTSTIFGYAIVPKGTGAGTAVAAWQASATAGKDKLPVVLATEGETFVAPADDTVTASQAGDACDIVLTSNTGTVVSQVNIGTSTEDVLLIQGLALGRVPGAAGTDVLVKINLANLQADT